MNSPYQRFLSKLNENGFFEHCTQQQREDTITLANSHKDNGNKYLQEKNYQKAIDEYSTALRMKEDPVYYGNRAAAYIAINEHLLAIEDCKKALQLDSNYAKAYGRLGVAYSKIDKLEEAKEALENALLIDPNNTIFKNGLNQVNTCISQKTLKEQESQQQESQQQEQQQEQQPQQDQNEHQNFENPFGGMGGLFSRNARGMTREMLNNPAMAPMIQSIAQMMGISLEDLQQQFQEETQGSSNQSTTQPPGYV
ncbi:Small glutamine-rich tetratricopeptide repeat-containing protein [Entamoeba marina]